MKKQPSPFHAALRQHRQFLTERPRMPGSSPVQQKSSGGPQAAAPFRAACEQHEKFLASRFQARPSAPCPPIQKKSTGRPHGRRPEPAGPVVVQPMDFAAMYRAERKSMLDASKKQAPKVKAPGPGSGEQEVKKAVVTLYMRSATTLDDFNGAAYYLGDEGEVPTTDATWRDNVRGSLRTTLTGGVGRHLLIIAVSGYVGTTEDYEHKLKKAHSLGGVRDESVVRASHQIERTDTAESLLEWVVNHM